MVKRQPMERVEVRTDEAGKLKGGIIVCKARDFNRNFWKFMGLVHGVRKESGNVKPEPK
jgi:hypothetical protein